MLSEEELKIIGRVRKLLSMASDAASPNEALIAARRARKMMDKHGITKEQIENPDDAKFGDLELDRADSGLVGWVIKLCNAACYLNDCRHVFQYGSRKYGLNARYRLQGFSGDVVVARLTTEYFIDTCQRLVKRSGAIGLAGKNAYRLGFSKAVEARCWAIYQERLASQYEGGTGLVLLKEQAIANHFSKTRPPHAKKAKELTPEEMHLFESGELDGNKVSLSPQIEGEDSTAGALAHG